MPKAYKNERFVNGSGRFGDNSPLTAISRLHFAHLPTTVEELQRLRQALGGPRLLIKRDDQTGLAFGGNKTRKLEFLVAEAREQSAKTLITGGALQSNHCRQTAAAAARFGFECILVLTGDMPEQASANLLLDQLFGAQIVYVADRKDRDKILQQTFDRAADEGKKPYLVPYGGSSPTGALGYAFAMKELMEQNVDADWIVFATSSGGTHAGLLVGQRRFGYKGKVLGISIDDAYQCGYCTSGQIMSAVALLKEPCGPEDSDVKEFMSGNICRCGAYPNIVAAIQSVRPNATPPKPA